MQAILTKFHGPTNLRGSRIHAKCAAGSLWVSYEHALNPDENHRAAAEALAGKLGWLDHHSLVCGSLPDGSYSHVLTLGPKLADSVMTWASTAGDHGGNPHCKAFVRLAERMIENEV